MTNSHKETALHLACQCVANRNGAKLVGKLLAIGGMDLALMKCRKGGTALHAACSTAYPTSIYWLEVIEVLIAVGGRELVLMINYFEYTGLHLVIIRNDLHHTAGTWVEIINRLVEVGGRDLVLMVDNKGRTALHCACSNNSSTHLEAVLRLIEVGRAELVLMTTENGHRAIELEFRKHIPCEEVISRFIEVSGEILMSTLVALE
jgi:ankyrin repeat protein